MKITIKLKNNPEGRIGVQIDHLTDIYEEICFKKYQEVAFDFVDIDFLYTTFILGLAVIISDLKNAGTTVIFINKKENISSYFSAICFPDGLMPDKMEQWPKTLENPSAKTFLPVVNFSNNRTNEETILRNNIISRFGRLLSDNLSFDTSIHTGISYFISEFTDNVVEHSGQERGWLFYQHYPKKEYVEISIR
jgi:hypothetical protein